MEEQLEEKIRSLITDYETPQRIAFSRRYPVLKRPIVFSRCLARSVQNLLDPGIHCKKENDFYKCIIARHQSVLRRKLGDSDPRLQENKITNLKQAVERLNGIVIKPNGIFSFWNAIGKPTYKDGYVDGMLLSNGKVIEGVGGGLCQLSNFLFWIFLHIPARIIERHHHSRDVFPDSGRVLPFGSGATVMYNFIDLKIRNEFEYPVQLKIWITDNYLKGNIVAPCFMPQKFHIVEKNHCFAKKGGNIFRYNEIFRETKINGKLINVEKITTNFSPVLYDVTDEYIQENNFRVFDF